MNTTELSIGNRSVDDAVHSVATLLATGIDSVGPEAGPRSFSSGHAFCSFAMALSYPGINNGGAAGAGPEMNVARAKNEAPFKPVFAQMSIANLTQAVSRVTLPRVNTTGLEEERSLGHEPSISDALMETDTVVVKGGFASGSLIVTARGEIPVESLVEGDMIVGLQKSMMLPIRRIGRQDVGPRTDPDRAALDPIRICADAFGPGQPYRNLLIAPDHRIFIDGQLVAVRCLVNGATIRQEIREKIRYHQIETETHDVMLVDGMPAESLLKISRGRKPDGGRETEACAPEMPGDEPLTNLRRRLLERAEGLGYTTTSIADLRVFAGKRRLSPKAISGSLTFLIPKGTGRVRLASRHFMPLLMRAAYPDDGRRLGVGVLAIELDGHDIALDDPRLLGGWHTPEPGLRWTDGEAWLRTSPARKLTLTLLEGPTYWSGEPKEPPSSMPELVVEQDCETRGA